MWSSFTPAPEATRTDLTVTQVLFPQMKVADTISLRIQEVFD